MNTFGDFGVSHTRMLSVLKGVAMGLSVFVASCGFNADDPWRSDGVISLAEPPGPIYGGTLLVTRDGSRAVVADPDRHRVVVSDLSTHAVRTLSLEAGLDLGRIAEDGAGHLHVVARSGGTVIEVDPSTVVEVARRPVCAAPRGIAWEAATSELHVACADGALVSLSFAGSSSGSSLGEEVRRVHVAADLRDVEVTDAGLLVTRFRSAETLLVRRDGTSETHRMPTASLTSPMSRELMQSYEPHAAVRIAGSGPSTFVLHQRARIGVESVTHETPSTTYSYSSRPTSNGVVTWSDPCGNAVVHAAVTGIASDGTAINVGMPVSRGVTPVDLAVSPGGRVAVAFAGDPGGRFSAGPQVVLASATDARRTGGTESCLPGEVRSGFPGQVISVAFAGERLIVHTRSPSLLIIEGEEPIDLGGASVVDTGHALFHLDLGGTIACASCHPGGAEDGHVWEFSATSPTRTQSLEGVVGLAPYHRAGSVATFTSLMRALEPQMDAPNLSAEHTDALELWLTSVPLPPRGSSVRPDLVHAGGLVFQREGCDSCHAGELGSDRRIHEVSTGRLTTAQLAGLAARGPYLHDGSAPDVATALAIHEATLGMDPAEVDALIAYLETR